MTSGEYETSPEGYELVKVLWVVLRRSRHPHSLDQVTVAFTSENRHEAETFMLGARKVTKEHSLYPDIYELAEC
jgi:hypothetical protein